MSTADALEIYNKICINTNWLVDLTKYLNDDTLRTKISDLKSYADAKSCEFTEKMEEEKKY